MSKHWKPDKFSYGRKPKVVRSGQGVQQSWDMMDEWNNAIGMFPPSSFYNESNSPKINQVLFWEVHAFCSSLPL